MISAPRRCRSRSLCCSIRLSQVLHVRLHGFGVDAADVDELVVVAVDEIALQVQHVGEAAGEAGAEIDAGAAEHATTPPVMYSQQ